MNLYDFPAIVWLRHDQRISFNPAIQKASKHKLLLFVFIYSPEEEAPWTPGDASKWWLHYSLEDLDKNLKTKGNYLYIDKGNTEKKLLEIIRLSKSKAVYWNKLYQPSLIKRDKDIIDTLTKKDIHVETFNSSLLNEPWDILKKDGTPYKVYSAYWKVAYKSINVENSRRGIKIPPPPKEMASRLDISDLKLTPKIPWDNGFKEFWQPGEKKAKKILSKFIREKVTNYDVDRDIPSISGTSLLSPYLHFGNISPKEIWAAVCNDPKVKSQSQQFLKELVWREFAAHLLYHFPHTDKEPLNSKFKKFPWSSSKLNLKAWQRGMTGYPIVDAGMRQLWHIGWMHNRVRMIVASFLSKDYKIKWQEGAKWFWDTLVDADLASNTMGWQWVAGCGADAAPYFRIFNPTLQGKRFDPEGVYIRKWIPELKDLPNKWIHNPWEAPKEVLEKASVGLGVNYPKPTIDHFVAKIKALDAYNKIKN